LCLQKESQYQFELLMRNANIEMVRIY